MSKLQESKDLHQQQLDKLWRVVFKGRPNKATYKQIDKLTMEVHKIDDILYPRKSKKA